jgi:hypothetical protein
VQEAAVPKRAVGPFVLQCDRDGASGDGHAGRVSRWPRTAFALVVLVVLAIFVAVASAKVWRHLRSARITVQNGSLPPPYGRAHVYRYTTRAAVAKVTKALNANHIASRPATNSGPCAGGFNLTVKLVARKTQTLTAYECGGHNYGGIAGNVSGFLSALGIVPP